MSGVIATLPKYQFSSATGAPLANGTLTVYVAGSTTPTNTWQDSALTIANTNPVTLDSRGECVLWLDSTVVYKFLLKNAGGVTQWTQDNISGAATPASLSASSGSSLIGFIQSGTGAVAETVQTKLRQYVSTADYDTPQHAVDAANVIEFPYGDISIGSTITVSANKTLVIKGTLKPSVNAASAGTPMILITGSNVTIRFEGGGIDCISAAYSNWCGIYANSTARLKSVHVKGGTFANIGVDNTAAYAVNLDAVDGGSIKGARLQNVGVVSNVVGGGYGLYMQYCADCEVTGNTLKTVGSTGVNNSCGTNNTISKNHLRDITLFGFKGGYGTSTGTVTSNVAATTSAFTITADANSRKRWITGAAFAVKNAATAFIGYVGSVTDNTTYLTIACSKAMDGTPEVGAEIQMLESGTVYSGNTLAFSGDNGFDINGWSDITISNNSLVSPGAKQDVGVYVGINGGIWLGYDPQGSGGSYNLLRSDGLTITGNRIRNAYNSAISITASADNVTITGNSLIDYNRANTAGRGGIEVTKLSFYRSYRHTITGNTCISTQGFGIYDSFVEGSLIEGNHIRSNFGIVVNSVNEGTVRGNHVKALQTGSAGYGILVSQASGNVCNDVVVEKNTVRVSGEYGIRVTDTSAQLVNVKGNDISSSSSTAFLIYDESEGSSSRISSGFKGTGADGFVRMTVAAGATTTLAEYFSDNGTIGEAIIEGVARSAFSGFELFKCIYYGNVTMPTVAFTSGGSPNASSFLASGDFTSTANSPAAGLVACKYTNNEANTVYMTLRVVSLSRI